MEEVFAPEDALDKPALKALVERSDARGLAHLAGHGALLIATGLWVGTAFGSGWLLPALVCHGIVLAFLFAPLHECIHYTAFRSRALNRTVAFLIGAVLFLPSEYFRAFHYAHHRYTQDPSRDPELARDKPETLGEYLLFLSGFVYWNEQALLFGRLLAGRVEERFVPERRKKALVREARGLVVLYLLIAFVSFDTGSTFAVIYWLLPLALGQPFLRAFLLAEHTGCPLVPDMLENTRTTNTNPLVRWLTWNMSFHAEHHAYPALPFHALPAAHKLMKDKIVHQSPGYIAAHWQILRRLMTEA